MKRKYTSLLTLLVVAGIISLAAMTLAASAAKDNAASKDSGATSAKAGQANANPSKAKPAKAKKLIANSNCSSCHAKDHKIVGPSFEAVAKRYAGQGQKAVKKLAMKIKHGGSGNWGKVAMPAHPNMKMANLETITRWILTLKNEQAPAQQQAKAKTYTYKTNKGKKIKTDFQVFKSDKQKAVTHNIFKGYELYNSYCFRCHGPDAVGGEYAPDLRHAITTGGVSHQQFVQTSMTGRKAKGMPSWAGFFNEKQINQIYHYVQARAKKLVPPGRPKTGGQ